MGEAAQELLCTPGSQRGGGGGGRECHLHPPAWPLRQPEQQSSQGRDLEITGNKRSMDSELQNTFSAGFGVVNAEFHTIH